MGHLLPELQTSLCHAYMLRCINVKELNDEELKNRIGDDDGEIDDEEFSCLMYNLINKLQFA